MKRFSLNTQFFLIQLNLHICLTGSSARLFSNRKKIIDETIVFLYAITLVLIHKLYIVLSLQPGNPCDTTAHAYHSYYNATFIRIFSLLLQSNQVNYLAPQLFQHALKHRFTRSRRENSCSLTCQ